MIDSVIQLFT